MSMAASRDGSRLYVAGTVIGTYGAGVVSVYGLTEAPVVALGAPRDPDDALAPSEGRAAGGAEQGWQSN